MKYIYDYFVLLLCTISLMCSGDTSQESLYRQLQVDPQKTADIVEVGGRYVGLEFHRGRSVPSRISFYYPKANSIDISTDYWERWKSMPLELLLASDGVIDTLSQNTIHQFYTPFDLRGWHEAHEYQINYSWQVCHELSVAVLKIEIKNLSKHRRDMELTSRLKSTFRTSHTYEWREAENVTYDQNQKIGMAAFSYVDTDSVVLFVANNGYSPDTRIVTQAEFVDKNQISFKYTAALEPDNAIEIIQLIGVAARTELDTLLDESLKHWQNSVKLNTDNVLDIAYKNSFYNVNDQSLQKTLHWSKALIVSNEHYLDGHFVMMPCPAQYNFFFTHDFLLTSLGVVHYDLDFLKNGYEFLYMLSHQDSVLAHAYYWKDTRYVTEFCANDNWNHLWFIISTASYLKHSGDLEMIEKLFPIIDKSLRMILLSKNADDLMVASRPDWWDIGNVNAARCYLTSLTYKAIHDYIYLCTNLCKHENELTDLYTLSQRMRQSLVKTFWDPEKKYLFNMLNSNTFDYHYYSGSLTAVIYDLLNDEMRNDLMMTAREQLLDDKIGLRNAMPPDFHELISQYKFNGLEMGLPWYYINGAVWPHGNAWYILGLIANHDIDLARESLYKYLSLDGIEASPNGQPSFYEYRITDKESSRYGEIDKPSFTWAAGFYINVLYRLSGIRENNWNIYLSPELPTSFDELSYDVYIEGSRCRVSWSGQSDYIKQIEIDGTRDYSAVLNRKAKTILIERGIPDHPYLAEADCIINRVLYNERSKYMELELKGYAGKQSHLKIVTPFKIEKDNADFPRFKIIHVDEDQSDIFNYTLQVDFLDTLNNIIIKFL